MEALLDNNADVIGYILLAVFLSAIVVAHALDPE